MPTMASRPDARLADNLRRWTASGQARVWVESRSGGWGEADWLVLLGNLRHTAFWPMDVRQVRAELERLAREKRERENLRRWAASGRARQWVERHRGRWGQADWLALLEELRASEFWPVRPAALREALDELRAEWGNVCRWAESGHPRRWIEAHRGRWGHGDWLALLAELRQSAFWPMDPDAVGEVLRAMQAEAGQSEREVSGAA
jgi:hypothetical protein